MALDLLGLDPQQIPLYIVVVGDDPAEEDVARAGNVGDPFPEQSPGATLGDRQLEPRRSAPFPSLRPTSRSRITPAAR